MQNKVSNGHETQWIPSDKHSRAYCLPKVSSKRCFQSAILIGKNNSRKNKLVIDRGTSWVNHLIIAEKLELILFTLVFE